MTYSDLPGDRRELRVKEFRLGKVFFLFYLVWSRRSSRVDRLITRHHICRDCDLSGPNVSGPSRLAQTQSARGRKSNPQEGPEL